MERDVGLDAHASSCTLGVMMPSGKRVGSHVGETNARCLIASVRQIPKPRRICLEEGTLSEWLYEVLSPHAEVVVWPCPHRFPDLSPRSLNGATPCLRGMVIPPRTTRLQQDGQETLEGGS